MPKVEEEILKTIIIEGTKSALFNTVANNAGKKVTVVLGKTVASNAAVGGLMGAIAGNAAVNVLGKASEHLPSLSKKIIETLGYGGFQRGEIAGAEKILEAVKSASLVTMSGYLMELVNLNPNTRFVKNACLVSGSVGAIYLGCQQLLKLQMAQKTSFLINESLGKQINIKIEKLYGSGKISESMVNQYQLEVAGNFNFVNLQRILDILKQY